MKDSQATKSVLYAISDRLSGREDSRGVEYVVRIDEDHRIHMTPHFGVFPNTHMRRESDKRSILDYVESKLAISTIRSSLVPGSYKYEKSVDGKRRRWTRL